MTFIEAIKTINPGQVLVSPLNGKTHIVNGMLQLFECNVLVKSVSFIDDDGWQIIDNQEESTR